jgi:hypothetical protein
VCFGGYEGKAILAENMRPSHMTDVVKGNMVNFPYTAKCSSSPKVVLFSATAEI